MRNRKTFYDYFAPFYPLVDLFLKPFKGKLFNRINQLPFGHVLDIGVGNGSCLGLYRTHKVIGIDTSFKMLEKAKKKNFTNIELEQMDGTSLTFENDTFDYVILSHIITVVDDPDELLEQIYGVLKPNGKVFILNHFTPNNWLKYMDRAFNYFSKIFHYKSNFYINDLKSIDKFRLIEEINYKPLSYIKLLIYSKK